MKVLTIKWLITTIGQLIFYMITIQIDGDNQKWSSITYWNRSKFARTRKLCNLDWIYVPGISFCSGSIRFVTDLDNRIRILTLRIRILPITMWLLTRNNFSKQHITDKRYQRQINVSGDQREEKYAKEHTSKKKRFSSGIHCI